MTTKTIQAREARKRAVERAAPVRTASPWLTTEEAAARAKVNRNTILRWVDSGTLKAYRIVREGVGRGITRFKASDVDALFEGGETE